MPINHDDAFIDGHQLVFFLPSVSATHRSDVIDTLLAAQLMATQKAQENVYPWAGYTGILGRLGWRLTQSWPELCCERLAPSSTVQAFVNQFAAKRFQPSTVGQIRAGMDCLAALPCNTPIDTKLRQAWLSEAAPCEADELQAPHEIRLRLAAVGEDDGLTQLHARLLINRHPGPNWLTQDMPESVIESVHIRAQHFTFNKRVYERLRPMIEPQLEPLRTTHITPMAGAEAREQKPDAPIQTFFPG